MNAWMNRTRWQKAVDLVEDHPFEIGLSCALILFGARALLSGLQTAPGSVQALPLVLAVVYCVLSFVGGALVLFGLIARTKIDWAYGAEIAGLCLSASAWASYVVGLSFSPITSKSTLLILALAFLALASLLRARAVTRKSRALLVALRRASDDRKEG